MNRRSRVDALGAIALIMFSVLLGLNQALVKLVNVGMAPVFQSGLRSACAFLIVLSAALLMRKKLCLTDGTLIPGIISGLLFSVEFYLLFSALEYTSVSRVSILFYTQPFWVALGAHYLLPGEQLNRIKAAGLIFAFSGVVLLLASTDETTGADTLVGDLMCVMAAIFWAMIVLVARKSQLSHSTPEMQLLYQLAVSAVVLLAVAFASGETFREIDLPIVMIFSFQVIFVVSIGFLLWFWALSTYPAAEMASFGLLTPLFGVFFGWLIFDDVLSFWLLVSLGIVCGGIVLNNLPARYAGGAPNRSG
jgi:drug/metabolite transporter (DMT)-like permease